VDGSQGVGAIDFDASSLDVDVVVVHGYKWMLSPAGAGFVCLRPRARERIRPSVLSWRSHDGWRNVDQLHHGAPRFSEDASRYEGGVLNFSGLFAMEAVLDLFASIGKERLFARTAEIAAATRRTLRAAGGRLAYDESPWFDSPIVTARFQGVEASELSAELKRRRILTAARKGALRVSPHFFNNEDDLATLETALADLATSR
jgi:selenocysteine lyase/cysteine desulfurase